MVNRSAENHRDLERRHAKEPRVEEPRYPVSPGGSGGGGGRPWRQWYARSMEVEATPLEITEPKRRKWGRYVYLLIVVVATALGVNYVAGKVLMYNASGTVGAEQYKLSPAATVTVKNIAVQPGQHVNKGDVLVSFSSPQLEQELARAKANIAEAQSRVSQRATSSRGDVAALQAEISGLHAQLQSLIQQYANKQSQYQSLKSLAHSGAVNQGDVLDAQQQMLEAKSKYEATAAKLRGDRARLKQLKGGDGQNSDQSTQDQTLASLKQLRKSLRHRLNDLQLTAPAKGVVAQIPVTTGQVVTAGEPTVIVVPGDDLRTLLYFPPAARARLHKGRNISVTTPDGTSVEMRIRQVFPSVRDLPPDLRDDVTKRGPSVVVMAVPENPRDIGAIAPGTPVKASISRWSAQRWASNIWSSVARVFGHGESGANSVDQGAGPNQKGAQISSRGASAG